MSNAHADTHVICYEDTHVSCLLAGLLDAVLMQIHMSAAYLLGCLMLCSCRYTCQLLTCWAAPDVGLKTE